LIEETKRAALARQRARLGELVALIRRRLTEVVEGFYDLGEALREILDKKLYAAIGHKSLEAFLEAEGLMSIRQASKLIAVVRGVPREQALALGQERAYALLAYTHATPEEDSPAALLAEAATVGGKPVAEASLRELQAATRAVRERTRVERPPSPAQRAEARADHALAKSVRASLRAAGFGRPVVTVLGGSVRVEFSRAQAERLAAR
jgi:hypothetical protein